MLGGAAVMLGGGAVEMGGAGGGVGPVNNHDKKRV